MPFCTNCGKPVKENFKFCSSCGNSVEMAASREAPADPTPVIAPEPAAPPDASASLASASAAEAVRVVIPGLSSPKAPGIRESYTLIITDRRTIFARVTNEVASEAMKIRQAKTEQKGFLARWKSQVAGPNMYVEWYQTRSPEQALNESAGNFALDNAVMRTFTVKCYPGSEDVRSEWHFTINTPAGTIKLISDSDWEKPMKKALI